MVESSRVFVRSGPARRTLHPHPARSAPECRLDHPGVEIAPGPSRWSATVGSALLFIALCARVLLRWNGLSSTDVQLALNILALLAWWIGSLYFVLWRTRFPARTLSSLFPALDGSASPVPFEPDRHPAAAGFRCISPSAVRGCGYSNRAKRHARAYSRIDHGGRPRVQQHSFEHDVAGHHHSSGALTVAFFLAKGGGCCRGDPPFRCKNGLRIFVLGVLTTKVDPSFMTGRLHRQGGVIYFLIALLGIFLLLWILRRGENEKPPIPATGSLEGRSIAGR